jgi:beta-phosphoglucomutase-like phosphatase (HAD superfamily)/dTDP-glucose pyrophosphorylase
MTKLIIFDLDGVLIDSKTIHFDALNNALNSLDPVYAVTIEEQKNIYEGLPTKAKLTLLNKNKGLPENKFDSVWRMKQEITSTMFSNISEDKELVRLFKIIKSNNIKIAVASNSISKTVYDCLKGLGLIDLIDYVVSNEDVKNPKPHPEMYWKAMSNFGAISDETVIFEDSLVGKLAARDSKANLIEIKDRSDLTENKINQAINILESKKSMWKDYGLNVLIPMAGFGSRFKSAGYVFPKPLVEVNGKPMIQAVVESLGINAKYTYIVQKEHYEKYNLSYLLNLITPDCNIIEVDGVTEGAAVTCLLAKEYINTSSPLIMANSDQIVEWNSREFIYDLMIKNADGGIATFKSTHPKWSYAKTNSDGLVFEVAEKKPISDTATVGIYYWKHGSDFVKYANNMIEKNIRTNNEFYVCPVFNEAIADGKRIFANNIDKMWGIGTPEDLKYYMENNKNDKNIS